MLNSTAFLLDILRNKIQTVEGTVVPVIKRSYPLDKSPCICLDDSPGSTVLNKRFVHKPEEYIVARTQSNINIHLYCDHEDQRDYLLGKIMQAVRRCEQDHYIYCTTLQENNICETTGMQCAVIEGHSARSTKFQCPLPEIYEYGNLFTKHNIIRNTFNVEHPFSADDLTKKPPLLHSVLRATMTYNDEYLVGGKISLRMTQNANIEGEP